MSTAETIIWLAQLWLIVGGCVAALFLTLGIDRIDEDARGAYVFRPLLIPGSLLLWPLVLWRWIALERGSGAWAPRYRPPRRAHLAVAVLLAIVAVATIAASVAVRQAWPADIAPVQLSEPEVAQ